MSKFIKGVFLDRGTLRAKELDFGKLDTALPGCEYYESSFGHEVMERIRDAHIVITNKAVLGKEAVKDAANLRMVSVAATGYNNVDLNETDRKGALVANVPSYCTSSVVEHVFALVFALARKLNEYVGLVNAGKWGVAKQFCMLDYKITEVSGKTLGIIGAGELGKAVVSVAGCFGMKTLIAERRGAAKPKPGRVEFERVLAESDVLSLHCPLVKETENIIGERELKMMKDSAILINTSRGGLVNEAALKEALLKGIIGGAGMDVLTEEPPRNGNILLDPDIPNLIVTPHVAWTGLESQQRLIDQTADNIEAFLNGNPINVVSGKR